MIRLFDDIESERDRVGACIRKYGSTSDHNLDWFSAYIIKEGGVPVFGEFEDGTGILAHKYSDEWRIWSDPLSSKSQFVDKIYEFVGKIFSNGPEKVWCVDASEFVRQGLIDKNNLSIDPVDYSMFWPVLKIDEYNSDLSGNNFKEMRNARNKFYKEHKVDVMSVKEVDNKKLHEIVEKWSQRASEKQGALNIYDLPYHNLIKSNFRGFKEPRVLIVNDEPVGINGGYEMINNSERFVGIVGIHNYSDKDLGSILWLEDLDWVKKNGYKEFDLQGHEGGGGLELKLRLGGAIEKKTETFLIKKKAFI